MNADNQTNSSPPSEQLPTDPMKEVPAPDPNGNVALHADEDVDDNIGNTIETTVTTSDNYLTVQSEQQPPWFDPDEEPDDNIGNRVDGPAHHERSAVLPDTTTATSAANNKRGRGSNSRGKRSANNAHNRERPSFKLGAEVFGNVTKVMPDALIIDITGKGTAIFDRAELSNDEPPQPGDQFIANVRGDGSRGGNIVLTLDMDRIERGRELARKALESRETVNGLVTGVIKGGVEVDLMGLRAFAPASHMSLRMGSDLEPFVGQRLPFKVMKFDKNGKEVVLSRREFIERQAAEQRTKSLEKLQVGQLVRGVVRSVMEWGVFVAIPEADDIEGLVHVTEASYKRGVNLSEMFKPGDEVDVKVLRMDNNGKLWLSAKAAAGDPWDNAAETFAVGSRHTGRVARMQPFGAFVELAPGVDGLIRTNDVSLKRVSHPEQVLEIGQEIEVIVANLDADNHKIGLHPAPPADWDEKPQQVSVHRIVNVEVISPESAGLVVRILGATGGRARGFIPAGQTGTSRGTDLRKEFPAGTKLEAKVLDIDNRRGETKLSIRALTHDSEKSAYKKYRAKVARESKFGTFGDLLSKHRPNK